MFEKSPHKTRWIGALGHKATSTHEKKEEPVKWSGIFFHSFVFAQGNLRTHAYLFNWLARVGLKGIPAPKLKDLQREKIVQYVEATIKTGKHRTARGIQEDVDANAERMIEALSSKGKAVLKIHYKKEDRWEEIDSRKQSEAEMLTEMIQTMITRECDLLKKEKEGRPITSRDPFASSIIDFGLLKRGMGDWKYDTLPPVYKRLWADIMSALEKPLYTKTDDPGLYTWYARRLMEILTVYISKHRSGPYALPPEDLKTVIEFGKHIEQIARDYLAHCKNIGDHANWQLQTADSDLNNTTGPFHSEIQK